MIVDREATGAKASGAEESVTDMVIVTQQQRGKALAQDSASRQKRASEELTRGGREASGGNGGTAEEAKDHPEDSDVACSQSAAAYESQVCRWDPVPAALIKRCCT